MIKISIIIIGYNSSEDLQKLLQSLNQLIINNELIEVIYVDDGSLDNSVKNFKDFRLNFTKKCDAFEKNRGRVFARERAASLASGNWLLFIQSNVVVDCNLITEYVRAINNNNVAIAGKIIYQSSDSLFENYLNDKKRGINNFKNYSSIHYRSFLFGNCMIKKAVFDSIKFNPVFKLYGGKELDFSYRLHQKFPNRMITCRSAIVTRMGFPDLITHCYRLIEYGNYNFNYLSDELKREVIKWPCLLYKNIFFNLIVIFMFWLTKRAYKISFLSYYIIKVGLLSAIVLGYYRAK